MHRYFSIAELKIRHFDRSEPRFTEIIDGVPPEMALGSEWRLLSDINLIWLEKTLQNACQRPTGSEEHLGMAVLFFFRLRSLLAGDQIDLFPEHFGEPQAGDF